MFSSLTSKLRDTFAKISGKSRLTEANITDSVNEVRLALLEADVNYGIVKDLVREIKERSLGIAVIKSVTPGQQFIKIVHDALVELMGGEQEPTLSLKGSPAVIMLCGLQGAGKTTQCAKLARYLVKHHRIQKPLLVPCDLQRPAAVEQLKLLAHQLGLVCFESADQDPVRVARAALEHAKQEGYDVVIVDTAGRLHIDEELMQQLEAMKKVLHPHELLFVANSTTGQDAVNVAMEFHRRLSITGSMLTMCDADSRGGAALSIAKCTGQPLKFEGVGERLEDLQLFNACAAAQRILGMGDTINLVRRAQEHVSEEEAKSMEKKLRDASFTYEDFLKQLQAIKKMGPLQGLLAMLPGASQMPLNQVNEKEFFKIEPMILSMTPNERLGVVEFSRSRIDRIARGSGTHEKDVKKLIQMFKQAREFCKNMPNMKQLQKMMGGGFPWR